MELSRDVTLATMKEIATEIFIAAKPSRVWKHLIGFSRYGDWNPFIIAIEGERAVGRRIVLTYRFMTADGRQADREVSARVVKLETENEIRWAHGGWLPGLMDVEEWVRIAPSKGGVKVHHRLRVSGLLAGTLGKDHETMHQLGFAAMNAALKDVVEAEAAAHAAQPVFSNDNTGALPSPPTDRRRAG
ncbi:MAG: SRPBCC domain-containing protein [Alphaproteobacteria bacterium]|nr:SRPBCC domain-containing protein [Alphaproteobacteria bacterium]